MIIGLVSVFIGSIDLKEIEAFCAAASQRGSEILQGKLLDENGNSFEANKIKHK